MKVKPLYIILTILLPFAGVGQSYFNVLNNGTFAFGSVLVQEDGYVLLGNKLTETNRVLYNTKINLNGDTIWNKTFGERPFIFFADNVAESTEKGFVMSASVKDTAASGFPTDIVILAFDSSGNNLWYHRIEHERESGAEDFIRLGENGFAVAGVSADFGDERGDFYLAKLSDTGKPEWEKTYGTPGFFEECRSVIQTNDGGFALSGVKDMPNGEWDIWVVKADGAGEVEWEQNYGSEDFQDFGGFLAQTGDDHLLLAYNADSAEAFNSTVPKMLKLDVNNGAVLKEKRWFNYTDAALLCKPIVNNDGTLVFSGIHTPDPINRPVGIIFKTMPDGELIWSREYYLRLDRSNYIYDIKPTSDSGYVFCGQSSDEQFGLSKGWIVKLDCHGNDSITYYEPGKACEVYSNITYYQHPVNEQIQLYPNPATDQVTIEFPEGLDVEAVDLVNATGQSVFRVALPVNGQRSMVNYRLNIAAYPPGLYWLKVQSKGGITFAKKFVLR